MLIKVLFHVHTRASQDSPTAVRTVVQFCQRHHIEVVAICDHQSMVSVGKAIELAQVLGVAVIPGVEYATDAGDVIGLFVQNMTTNRQVAEVIRSIKDQQGLVVLPHPFRNHDLGRIPLEQVDLIESFNSRVTRAENERARELALSLGKPDLAGTDAHLPGELGLALNRFELPDVDLHDPQALKDCLLYAPRTFDHRSTSYGNIYLSQAVKGVRQGHPGLVLRSAVGWLAAPVRERWLGGPSPGR